MPSPREPGPAPLYLELAPPGDADARIAHLFVFRDAGVLSGGGSGRFATDLFTLSLTRRSDGSGDGTGGPHLSLARPRPGFVPRQASFCGIVAGLRLSSRPERLPPAETLAPLTSALCRALTDDDHLAALVTALDALARALTFAAAPQAFSDRTGRRRTRADTGVSRRRLASIRRFRALLGRIGHPALPLCDLALEAGYYDQSHMTACCRAFAGAPPGALRARAAARPADLSLQDAQVGDRLRLVIMDEGKE